MITSPAPGHTLDRLRRAAGPGPLGSKLTDAERLHLIYMIGAMSQAGVLGLDEVEDAYRVLIRDQLVPRGLTADLIAGAFRRYFRDGDVVAVVDAIAVHPSLQAQDHLH